MIRYLLVNVKAPNFYTLTKVRVPKRGVAPFGFPRHFRFSDTKPTLPFLHPHPGNQRSTVAIFKGDVDSASL